MIVKFHRRLKGTFGAIHVNLYGVKCTLIVKLWLRNNDFILTNIMNFQGENLFVFCWFEDDIFIDILLLNYSWVYVINDLLVDLITIHNEWISGPKLWLWVRSFDVYRTTI